MIKNLSMLLLCDAYKLAHRRLYPKGMETCYSTWTPRTSRIEGVNHVVVAGIQPFVKTYLLDAFQTHFFGRSKASVVAEYRRVVKNTLGEANPETQHIEELHDLGYLPLMIKALPEGTVVPIRTPILTIENTDHRFFWLTNYIETLMSCELWQASTSATIAHEYRKLVEKYAMETVGNTGFCQFQGHDFSMRGMSSLSSAVTSGLGHLMSFVGTDTIPAIQAAETFYGADVEKELIGCSVPASEHSIQSAYGDDDEYFRQIITEIHPTGIVSIVSDGYDFWDVIGRVLPSLKDKIMARDGKVVIRPDSGDPVKIVCGDPDGVTELERKGAVEALFDLFGGTKSAKGYWELCPKIGLIYGDAITLTRAKEIMHRLMLKGFASTNVVFGIGSYTYQYNTRDTFGFALKSTWCRIDGLGKMIFKNPKTDDGTKKSQKGKVVVVRAPDTGEISFKDGIKDWIDYASDILEPVFRNGRLLRNETFAEIRARLAATR